MKIESLLGDLTSDDPARVEAAVAGAVRRAGSVLPALLRGLEEKRSTAGTTGGA
ncbi:hypothetical protein [Streptomyces griseus]|uniref:hypothetical protein n=1 Tax=Streptomyces griseus TaxID=1911 RepID=UPI000AB38D80|nr:hypothetical protein [Streptomyces griseus]